MKHPNRKLKIAGCFLLCGLLLSACSSVKRELGVGRNSPDEFLVVKRAPLTLPPEYTLRAPGEAGAVTSGAEIAGRTKETVLGKTSAGEAVFGAPEETFLAKLGASPAHNDVRRRIDEENGLITLENQALVEKLIFWNDEEKPVKTPSSIVDPAKEAERLKKNREEGKPLNEGDVPVIEKKLGTIDKIF